MTSRLLRQLVSLQAAGFGLVILLIWADELLDLPRMLLRATPTPPRVSEATLESLAVMALGLLTILLTRRLVRRVHYLESFMVLCGWCRRVRDGQEWVTLERFLATRQTTASHGICPACEERLHAGAAAES
jgi:hypothetical protein